VDIFGIGEITYFFEARPLTVNSGLMFVNKTSQFFEHKKLRHDWIFLRRGFDSVSRGAFIQKMVPVRRVVKLVLDNKIVNRFLDFTPGSRELVTLSRLGTLVGDYDLIVVDMPASGHAFSLLDVLRSAIGLFRSGPVRKLAHDLRALLHDPGTRVVFVALPEEMVVNETLETLDRMKRAEVLGGPPAVFLNRATLPSMTDAERVVIQRLSEAPLDPMAYEFVRAGRWEDQLEQATADSRDRLAQVFPSSPILVPPAGAGGVPRHVVASVAVHLGRQVGVTRRDLPWI
jgi:anion-transporting  ArsA/GET3 family ATPase